MRRRSWALVEPKRRRSSRAASANATWCWEPEGPGEAAAKFVLATGAILLASAFGAWTLAATMRGMGKTVAAYGAFAALFLWLRSALGAERGPWPEAMLGALLGAIGVALYLALGRSFRRVVRSRA